MPSFKLTYFGTKGVAEPIRYFLAHGNHKYEEVKVDFHDWPQRRGEFPVKKLPTFEIDGKIYTQSSAICRYFANQQGLAGKNEMENLIIDSTVDTIVDLRNACGSYFWDQMPASKDAKKAPLQNDTVPTYMDHLEKQAKRQRWISCLKKLTWADVLLAASTDYIGHTSGVDLFKGRPTLKALVEKVNNLPGIKEHLAKRPKTDF